MAVSSEKSPVLSFILCSRNDNYMGNPVGRLQLAINFLAENLALVGQAGAAEIIVTDWGSEVPLKSALNLNATAAQITKFLEVPLALVKAVQKDSPFAEVLALNAAARRSSGRFIGRIDQDTLVGPDFLRTFFAWAGGAKSPVADLSHSYLFSKRRQIPFDFAMNVTSLGQVRKLLKLCSRRLLIEEWPPLYFYSPVGIMVVGRELWMKCGGYDERLLYWGWMEVDFAYRLEGKFELADIGPLVKHDFYHLEHYDPRLPRKTPRKTNPTVTAHLEFHPNGQDWGLVNHPLTLCAYTGGTGAKSIASGAGKPVNPVKTAIHEIIISIGRDARRLTIRGIAALGRPQRYGLYFKRIFGFTSR